MVKFRDLSQAASKLKTNGANAAPFYTANAKGAAATWASNAAAAEQNWAQGVQGAVSRNAFATGVNNAGASKYANAIDSKGSARFADGISKAGPAWTAGFGKIAQTVAGTDIGPRGPRGSQANKQRSAAMQDAFRKAAGRAA